MNKKVLSVAKVPTITTAITMLPLNCIPNHCYEVSTRFWTLLLIFTINANIVNITQATQQFKTSPEGIYPGLNGQRLYIPCVIQNLVGECHWIKNNQAISPIAGKYDFVRKPSNGNCSINIHNLDIQQHEGDWQCQIPQSKYDMGLTSDNVKVVVLVAPSHPYITNISLNQVVTVKADQNNQIECVSQNGNPVPRMEWYINDQNVTINSKTTSYMTTSDSPKVISVLNYLFKSIHRNSTISCVSIHPTVNQTIKVFLKVMGKPEIINKKDTSYGYMGTDTDMEQIFCSDPLPTQVYWQYGAIRVYINNNILNNSGIFISDNTKVFKQNKTRQLVSIDKHIGSWFKGTCFRTVLSIANTDESDEREYKLYVQNLYGFAESIIKLKVRSSNSMAIMTTIVFIVLMLYLAITLINIFIKRRKLAKNKANESKVKTQDIPMTLAAVATQIDLSTIV